MSILVLWKKCIRRDVYSDTTLCDNICQSLEIGRWFPQDTPVSSTNKTDRHDITEILLKVALNTINHKPPNSKTVWKSAVNKCCPSKKQQSHLQNNSDYDKYVFTQNSPSHTILFISIAKYAISLICNMGVQIIWHTILINLIITLVYKFNVLKYIQFYWNCPMYAAFLLFVGNMITVIK